jgi:hypothetical protein
MTANDNITQTLVTSPPRASRQRSGEPAGRPFHLPRLQRDSARVHRILGLTYLTAATVGGLAGLGMAPTAYTASTPPSASPPWAAAGSGAGGPGSG